MDTVQEDTFNKSEENNEFGEIEVTWKKPPSVSDLKADLTESLTNHSAHMARVSRWMDNFHTKGNAAAKTVKGQSSVTPKLIRKQAEWRYPALSEPFLSTKELFKVKPVTWEDTKSAVQNALMLNHQFNLKVSKVSFIDSMVRRLVNEGTVIVKTTWDYQDEEYTEEEPSFEFEESLEIVEQLQDSLTLKTENPNEYARVVPTEIQQAVDILETQGIPTKPVFIENVEVTKTRIVENKPNLEICNLNNVYLDTSAKGKPDKANFAIHSFETSKSELKKDGRYFNLDDILLENNNPVSDDNHAANNVENSSFNFKDDARKRFIVYEYWGYRDLDGSGMTKPFVASWVGNTFIRLEDNPFPDKKIPFTIVPYLPIEDSFYGEPDGELIEDNQKIIGAVTRGMLDLMGKSANSQTGTMKGLLDYTNRRKLEEGKNYEFNPNADPRMGIYTHTYPDIPVSAQYVLDQQNAEAESFTGVKAFDGGLNSGSLGDVATGIKGVLDAASKRELAILRRFSEGLIAIGKKIVAMNGEFLSEEEVIRVTNEEFISVRKDELQGEFDLELSISTLEEDDARAKEISFMLQTMGNTLDFAITQMLLVEFFTLRKMPDVAKAMKDFKPEPDPFQEQMQQLELAKIQAEIAEIESRTHENITDSELNLAKSEEARAKADITALDHVEQETGTKQERDLQISGAQARANMDLKILEGNIKQATNQGK